MKKIIFFLMLFIGIQSMYSQTKTIKGKVTGVNNTPVAALIEIQGDEVSTVSADEQGNYSLEVEPGKTLVFSFEGLEPKNVIVGNETTINVSLKPLEKLQEVVVTALGIKKEKKSLGFAVQEIKGQGLVEAREPNVTNALSGKVSGLQVVKGSNGPGSSSKIILRGMTSLTGSNQPLIVVDGVPISNETGAQLGGFDKTISMYTPPADLGNGLSDINAEDIESISVLKGPTAAALYGSRAGSGVILITTKSGRKQKGLGVTFTASVGFESIFATPRRQSSFGQGRDDVFDRTSADSWGPKIQGQLVEDWRGFDEKGQVKVDEFGKPLYPNSPIKDYNNMKNYYDKSGFTQNYGLAFQQVVNKTSIYASVNKLMEESYIPGAKLERTNLMGRTSTRFGETEKWTLDTKVQYTRTIGTNRPRQGMDFSQFFLINTLPSSFDIRTLNSNTGLGETATYFDSKVARVNPYWAQNNVFNQDIRDRYIMSGILKYKVTNWLDAEFKPGVDMYTTSTEEGFYGGSPTSKNGRYKAYKSTFSETNYMFMLNAKKTDLFGKIGGMATIGGNLMEQKSSRIGADVTELDIPNYFNLSNSKNPTKTDQSIYHKKVNSVFASAQISYDNYLFLDATFRNDWSSALIKSNRSYFYPSVSLSYVFTDMLDKYQVKLPWLSFGKLRLGYSQVGNDMPAYNLYNVYLPDKNALGNTITKRGLTLLDPYIKPEAVKNIEIGTELKFLDNKISLDFTTYKTNSTNQIIDIPLDPSSGYEFKRVNVGNIENRGFEISVDAKILNNPDLLSWNVSLNYSHNKTKILELTNDLDEYPLLGGTFEDLRITNKVGGLYGDLYGSSFLKVTDPNSPFYGQKIVNKDGIYQKDTSKKGGEYLGNQQPKALVGLTNSFSHKGFTFSFLIDGRFGGKIFSSTLASMQKAGTSNKTVINGDRDLIIAEGVQNIGTADNPNYVVNDKQVKPQQYWDAITINNLGINEANVYDATNIRLRNIQLSYNFPSKFLAPLLIQKAVIGVSCNNVWLISSHMNGLDPESVFATGTNALGFENGGAPTVRTILFNLAVTF